MDKALNGRLVEHQRVVRGITERARPLLHEGADPVAMELARLRWELVRELNAYQQFKHREIFDPAMTRGSGQLARMGEAMKADCVSMGEAFTRYVRRWSGRDTVTEWDSYRSATIAILDQIDRHLRREEANVASMLRVGRMMAPAIWPQRMG